MKFKMLIILLFVSSLVFGQDKAPDNWFNLDKTTDGVQGVSTEKTYKELLKGMKSHPVIVAVIDGGVDYKHEDLKEVIWTNKKEIPGNKIDDDHNGYVDDIHGWNFMGNTKGESVNGDQLEVTRLYVKYKKMFDGVDPEKLSRKKRKTYDFYLKIKKEVEEKLADNKTKLAMYQGIMDALNTIKKEIGSDDFGIDDLDKIKSTDETVQRVKTILSGVLAQGGKVSDLEGQLQGAIDYFSDNVKYNYNPDFDGRSLVGDNYDDVHEIGYGNNDVKGPDASHGTHVSGIIAAKRHNNIGMDGIADNVLIMGVRAVPNGDERDKDVANAIRYAVDNGAQIINMSFGKSYVWNKKVVDDAVKYAVKHDVLLVHAAGNDGKENTTTNNYPNDTYLRRCIFGKKTARTWIEVGALSWKGGEDALAEFSNYSNEYVDLFAPGVAIYSTTPDDHYASYNGTSMASPVVAGVAAVIRSYFPSLTAAQVKDILLKSVTPIPGKLKKPGDGSEKVTMKDVCVTGGVVNLYNAVKLAKKTKGKKKIKA